MIPYTLRRLAATIPVLVVVTVFTFGLLYLVPGDPVDVIYGDDPSATPERLAALREEMGLADPPLQRLWDFVSGAVVGDFGDSPFLSTSIGEEILRRGEITLLLAALSIIITLLLGFPLGVIAALRRGSWLDTVLGGMSSLFIAVPSFLVGIILAYVFGARLGWLPAAGYVPLSEGVGASLRSLLLPSAALALAHVALVARLMRTQCIDALNSAYVRAARSRGVQGSKIFFSYVARNSVTPTLSIMGVLLGAALSGSIVIEIVFGLPGLGNLTVHALNNRDFFVVQAVMLVATVIHVLATLIADLLIGLVDPRVRTS